LAPSFKAIAKRYSTNQIDELSKSIKNGSRGKWKGFKLSMPPFKDLKDHEAKSMAKWILSLSRL
jgi:cytochrome c551/c552